MRILSLFTALLLSFPNVGAAQQATTPASANSGQAMALLSQSTAALTGGVTLTDVTLSGTARRIAGSDDETGTAVLKALATGESRIDLTLSSGQRSEVRAISNHCQVGIWTGPNGVAHPISNHNLMTDSSWFFPALTLARLLGSQSYAFSYVGAEARNGQPVQHLQIWQASTFQMPAHVPTPQHLSQMDLFLDSTTLLPAALAFNTHPDSDMGLDIPIEIRFSDYRLVNGAQVPFHVQKFLNNSLVLDLQFQTTAMNTGLTAAAFSIQ